MFIDCIICKNNFKNDRGKKILLYLIKYWWKILDVRHSTIEERKQFLGTSDRIAFKPSS